MVSRGIRQSLFNPVFHTHRKSAGRHTEPFSYPPFFSGYFHENSQMLFHPFLTVPRLRRFGCFYFSISNLHSFLTSIYICLHILAWLRNGVGYCLWKSLLRSRHLQNGGHTKILAVDLYGRVLALFFHATRNFTEISHGGRRHLKAILLNWLQLGQRIKAVRCWRRLGT